MNQYSDAVRQIKTAILQSQAKALAGVNQEQLALYYGIGRYISQNSRSGFWGKDAIETISRQLSAEMPGLRGFSARNLRNMRTFYEQWKLLDSNLAVATAKLEPSDVQRFLLAGFYQYRAIGSERRGGGNEKINVYLRMKSSTNPATASNRRVPQRLG